jgi:hypothetical protein
MTLTLLISVFRLMEILRNWRGLIEHLSTDRFLCPCQRSGWISLLMAPALPHRPV